MAESQQILFVAFVTKTRRTGASGLGVWIYGRCLNLKGKHTVDVVEKLPAYPSIDSAWYSYF